MSIPMSSQKITAAVWGPLDEVILTGHNNGDLCQWDIKVCVVHQCLLLYFQADFKWMMLFGCC